MRMQHDDLAEGRAARSTDDLDGSGADDRPQKEYGFVAVCAGSGIADTFRDLGADVIVEGGQTMNPSTEDILTAIRKTPAETVFVLPNNKNIIMAAEQARDLVKDRNVIVIPSKTVPQGFTAMMNFESSLSCEQLTQAMTDCLDSVMTMQITYAARDSDFDGRDIHEGDYLGLCGGSLLSTDRELAGILRLMAQKVAEENRQFVNVFFGEDISEEQAQEAAAIFAEAAPDAEVNVIYGGQPIYYYMISAE